MRYRPFGVAGKAVSAVSLLLREAPNMTTPQAWRTMVFSAMENGINCFEVSAGLDVAALGLGEALRAVERRLIFISWRLRGDGSHPMSARAIADSVRGGLQRTGAGYFDLLTMDEAAYESLEPDAHGYLSDLRASGRIAQGDRSTDTPALPGDNGPASGQVESVCGHAHGSPPCGDQAWAGPTLDDTNRLPSGTG